MPDLMLQPRSLGDHQVQQTDRRRPGRMANPSAELIPLMRRPTRATRVRIALYDAPGFLPQAQASHPRRHRGGLVQTIVAATACSAATAAMFQGMLLAWG